MNRILFIFFLAYFNLIAYSIPAKCQQRKKVIYSIENAKTDSLINHKMIENNIPGLSLAILKEGQIIYSKGYGLANLELPVIVKPTSIFAIYSITKTFTAVSIMLLSDEGKLSIHDTIGKYLSKIPATWTKITIQHLLTHTSGLPELCESLTQLCYTESKVTQAQVLESVANMPMQFPPGEKWEYNNTGFFLLGLIIEHVSGKTYGEFIQERIFNPLGMKDSKLQNYEEVIPNRVNGYTWKNNTYHNAIKTTPSLSFSLGGIISSVLDLAKYDSAFYTEKLLRKSTLDQMFTKIRLNNGEMINQGLGFSLTPFQGHRRIGHSGGHAGFATAITRIFDDKITVIILSNSDSKGHKERGGFLIGNMANEIALFYLKIADN